MDWVRDRSQSLLPEHFLRELPTRPAPRTCFPKWHPYHLYLGPRPPIVSIPADSGGHHPDSVPVSHMSECSIGKALSEPALHVPPLLWFPCPVLGRLGVVVWNMLPGSLHEIKPRSHLPQGLGPLEPCCRQVLASWDFFPLAVLLLGRSFS